MIDAPQKKVVVHYKEAKGTGTELLTFTMPFGIFELIGVLPIPEEGTDRTNGFVKLRLAQSNTANDPNSLANSQLFQQVCQMFGFALRQNTTCTNQSRKDREDVRDD